MRTMAQEISSPIALRNCSKEVGGGVGIYVILVKEVCAAKHTSRQKVPAGHKEQMSPSRISMLF